MPIAAPKPCGHPGCGKLVRDGSGRCEAHQSEAWVKKPTATKRITGRKLQRMRAELFTANPLCVECSKLGLVKLATQRDHIRSLEEGGLDVPENTQGLCDDCHNAKSLAERLRAQARSRGN
jgi:5-methylcytosine-specific restriction protein A